MSHTAAMAARRAAAPPIQALAAAGCTIAMGSDNMAEDMVEVMRTGLFMERVARQDAQSPQPEDVLEWAARNGARALGHGNVTGSLEVGKKADFFVVDVRRPNLVPAVRIVSAFVHNGQASDVRSAMVEQQRALASRGRIVMVGRDIGTVVLPDAERKIFLTASAAERARRREEELAARGEHRPRPELLAEILRRDELDSHRAVAPLRAADDATIVETDGMSVREALGRVLSLVQRPVAT